MTTETDTSVLGLIAERMNAMAPIAQRAARHRSLVGATNGIISAYAEQHLAFDSDPRSFEAFVRHPLPTPPEHASTYEAPDGESDAGDGEGLEDTSDDALEDTK